MNPLVELTDRYPDWMRRWRATRARIDAIMYERRAPVIARQLAEMRGAAW